jgi:hypothetical protein
MAFLQRIINGGGNINREMAVDKGRIDLCLVYKNWLVIFNRDVEAKWDDKIYMRKEAVEGKNITVVGC